MKYVNSCSVLQGETPYDSFKRVFSDSVETRKLDLTVLEMLGLIQVHTYANNICEPLPLEIFTFSYRIINLINVYETGQKVVQFSSIKETSLGLTGFALYFLSISLYIKILYLYSKNEIRCSKNLYNRVI